MLHLQRGAKMRNEAFGEFDGVAGGQVRPLGAGETRQLGIVFEVDAGGFGIVEQAFPIARARVLPVFERL